MEQMGLLKMPPVTKKINQTSANNSFEGFFSVTLPNLYGTNTSVHSRTKKVVKLNQKDDEVESKGIRTKYRMRNNLKI